MCQNREQYLMEAIAQQMELLRLGAAQIVACANSKNLCYPSGMALALVHDRQMRTICANTRIFIDCLDSGVMRDKFISDCRDILMVAASSLNMFSSMEDADDSDCIVPPKWFEDFKL